MGISADLGVVAERGVVSGDGLGDLSAAVVVPGPRDIAVSGCAQGKERLSGQPSDAPGARGREIG